ELVGMINELFIDDTVDIIEEMPANVVKRIIKSCTPETRDAINKILEYPEDSAGSIMTPEYISLRKDMTVQQAFERIRKIGLDSETVYTCYVLAADRTLLGVVTVRELLMSDPHKTVDELMNANIVYVETTEDKETVAKLFDRYDFLAFPVVDKEKRMVGIVTVDDAMDVIREEATEDFSKMAAVVPIEESYFKASVFKHARNRILWLIILMVSATITGSIITNYETAFQALPLLIACLPMLMDTGGNCGAQTSTMVIRGMAIDEMRPRDVLKVWWKEIRIALIVGMTLAIINFGRVLLLYGADQLQLGFTTSLALVFTVCLAQTLGCMMPMAAKACKLDPAIMASPLITTIVDALSVTVFFTIAVWIFQIA
ncbi:MAG: magnesium transporter, partial [Clostridia bacterium]|nr:magnesium transporter [Clostridia bacterium]